MNNIIINNILVINVIIMNIFATKRITNDEYYTKFGN